MNPQIISLIGIFLALFLVVAGSLRGISIIILSSAAAFLVAATGGIGLLDGYSAYLEGVAGSVTSMFPLFLGGQLLGCFLEKSGLTESIANAVIRRSGTRGIVVAVFTVSWLLTFCGINVFVIIFTVYPIACAFFKVGDIPRSLIPACVLGACVSQQMLPGIADTTNILARGTHCGTIPHHPNRPPRQAPVHLLNQDLPLFRSVHHLMYRLASPNIPFLSGAFGNIFEFFSHIRPESPGPVRCIRFPSDRPTPVLFRGRQHQRFGECPLLPELPCFWQ